MAFKDDLAKGSILEKSYIDSSHPEIIYIVKVKKDILFPKESSAITADLYHSTSGEYLGRAKRDLSVCLNDSTAPKEFTPKVIFPAVPGRDFF